MPTSNAVLFVTRLTAILALGLIIHPNYILFYADGPLSGRLHPYLFMA